MGIAGYKIVDNKGNVIDQLVGTQPRHILNKYRKSGLKVKKMKMPKFA